MQLCNAPTDCRRHVDHPTRFLDGRRTISDLFLGLGDRLVCIEADSPFRSFGYPPFRLWDVEHSRLGVRSVGDNAGVYQFDEDTSQSYAGDDTFAVTDYEIPRGDVTQYDFAIGSRYVSRFETDADVKSVVFVHFQPSGRDTLVRQLTHDDMMETYHAEEHSFLVSSPVFEHVEGRVPEGFDELLSEGEIELPQPRTDSCYEEGQLSGAVIGTVPSELDTAAVGHLLTNDTKTDHGGVLGRVHDLAAHDLDNLRKRAAAEAEGAVPDHREPAVMRDDIRVPSLSSRVLGLRIAGPNFGPYYAYSGGYGYMWFRGDAETSTLPFESDERLDPGLDAWHECGARVYCHTQCEDGSWSRRVQPFDGSLVPGRANARLESGDNVDCQADQTGSVIALPTACHDRCAGSDLYTDTEEALSRALDSLDGTLDDDGLPVDCQNVWENTTDRLSHTAAMLLEAYAALALSGLDSVLADRVASRAHEVHEGVDHLQSEDHDRYALHVADGELDDRYNPTVLALTSAHRTHDRLEATNSDRLDRPAHYIESVFDSLWYGPDDGKMKGPVRFEGDDWRIREQSSKKARTVSTV